MRWLAAAVAVVVGVVGVVLVVGSPDDQPSPPAPEGSAPSVPCSFWYAIGDRPSATELAEAARQDTVVVLNAWETDALRTLKELNPNIRVLVYKDLSSTRSYEVEDLGQGDRSAAGLPYAVTAREQPDWFARDEDGRRIEWDPYPGHWQMTVWDPDYQRAWTDAVTEEVVSAGWDGVLADNDFASLRFYTSAVVAGTGGRRATDELIRDGLDQFITTAGERLQAAGKILVPNVSEARLYPGRWEQHARFGGAMEENFAYFASTDQFVDGADWVEQTAQLSDPALLSLAITRTGTGASREQRYGFASAAIRGAGAACWMLSTTEEYTQRSRAADQEAPLGAPLGPGTDNGNGIWTREFQNGWVAVNPTSAESTVEPAPGFSPGPITIAPADSVVLRR